MKLKILFFLVLILSPVAMFAQGVPQGNTPEGPFFGRDKRFGADVTLADQTVLGSETLTETTFATVLNWSRTGDFALTAGVGAVYTHAAGSGTLTQATANFAIPAVGNSYYFLNYTIAASTGSTTLSFTTSFLATAQSLSVSTGAHTVVVQAKNAPSDFVLSATSTSGGFTITAVSLKQIQGGDLQISGQLFLGNLPSDPTGRNGATYYNTTTNVFKCYAGGAWTTCAAAGGGIVGTIAANQVAYGTGANTIGGSNNFTFNGTEIDAGASTSFEIPNGAAPTVDAFGEIAGDNDLWAAGRGAPIFFDGTAATALVNVLVSDAPSNGQVPTWNTGGTITWETPSAGSPAGVGTELQYRNGGAFGAVTASSVSGGNITLVGTATSQRDAIGTTSTDGLILLNTTDAAAGAQQYSPRLRFTSEGWKTDAGGASMVTDWMVENQPVQGAAAPTSNLVFSSQINGGGYGAKLTLLSGATTAVTGLSITSNAAGSHVVLSPTSSNADEDIRITPKGSGLVRIGGTSTVLVYNSTGAIDNYTSGSIKFQISVAGLIAVGSSGGLTFGSGVDTSSPDLFLRRDAAATLELGLDAASAVNQTFKAHDARAGTDTDTAGAALNIAGGRGTGTGLGGVLNLQTSQPTTTGTGAGTLTTRLSINSTGAVTQGTAEGAATSITKLVVKKTAIGDNSATSVITVTVPNANHAATIRLLILSSNGSTDAFESSRTAEGSVVLARVTNADTVAAVSTLEATQIATVGSGATHTLAYSVTAMTGAANATQTFTIQVTVDDSGNTGGNQCVIYAECLNSEASGVTIAAS